MLLAFGIMAFSISNTNGLEYPEHFPEPQYNFNSNPLSKEKVA